MDVDRLPRAAFVDGPLVQDSVEFAAAAIAVSESVAGQEDRRAVV